MLIDRFIHVFIDTIFYIRDTLTIEEVYDALFSKKEVKNFVGYEAYGDDVVDSGYVRGRSKFDFSNQICKYCQKKGT